jgi:hypothetical protein
MEDALAGLAHLLAPREGDLAIRAAMTGWFAAALTAAL